MAINKEKLRKVVIKAINQMPYTGIVTRKGTDKYHKVNNNVPVVTLIGLKYSPSESQKININVNDSGVTTNNVETRFLTVYNEDSLKVKKGDFITINDKKYIIKELGNTNEICFDIQLEVME